MQGRHSHKVNQGHFADVVRRQIQESCGPVMALIKDLNYDDGIKKGLEAELLASIFITLTVLYSAGVTAPRVYKVSSAMVRSWILKYRGYSEEFVSNTFGQDLLKVRQLFETVSWKINNLLPNFYRLGGNTTAEEFDRHLKGLTICLAQMMGTDPEAYGKDKPLDEVSLEKLSEIIGNILRVTEQKMTAPTAPEAALGLSVNEAYGQLYPQFYDLMEKYAKLGLKKGADVFLRSWVVSTLSVGYSFCHRPGAAQLNKPLAYLVKNMRAELADQAEPHMDQQSRTQYAMSTALGYRTAIEADYNLIKTKLSGGKHYSTLEHDRQIWQNSWLAFHVAILESEARASDDQLLKNQADLLYDSFRRLMDGTMICFSPASVMLK